MSFFGVTMLGYQDSVKSRLADKRPTTVSNGLSDQKTKYVRLPPISNSGRVTDHHNNYTNPAKGNEGSHSKHITLLKKHVRSRYNPNDRYRVQLTDMMNHGWELPKDDSPLYEKFPWAKTPRYVICNSQMTRFVDEMALTNREFSLF